MPPAVLTVTFSLMVSVSVTVLPALKSPLEGDSTTDDTVGAVVSICWAALGNAGQRQVGGIAGVVLDGTTVEIDPRHHEVGGVLHRPARCS